MRRVLVTRPEPGARRTAERLRAMGFEPLVLPLSETKPLVVDAAALPENFSAVAVTSANAMRHAPAGLIGRLADLPCFAVGERTAIAAREAGFRTVRAGPGDAAGLAETIAPELAGRRLAYLCGRERFPVFEERLAAAGVQVGPIETYGTVALDPSDDAILPIIGGRPVDAILLYSVKAADAAARLVSRPSLTTCLAHAPAFSLSARIDAAFRAAGGKGAAYIAASPDEDALLVLLRAED